jgi:hypothetical protein
MEAAAWQFLAISTVCFAIAAISLWSGKALCLIWLQDFIVRREREPAQFGCSVAAFAGVGVFLVFVVIWTH